MIHKKDKPSFDELVDKLVDQAIQSSKDRLRNTEGGGLSDEPELGEADVTPEKSKQKPKEAGH